MRSKPDLCYQLQCPLAVLCQCKHHEDFHPLHGHCTFMKDEVLCSCNGFQSKGKGFVLGVGNPLTAKLAIILEAPGKEEVSFSLEGKGAEGIIPLDEVERRRRDYPTLEGRFIKMGAPIVGRSGSLINQWVLPKVGMERSEIFIDNTLRCLPPPNKTGASYPIGEEKGKAEFCCRQYDRVQHFPGKVVEVSLHPASLLREVTPLPLLIKDFEKAVSFIRQGYKTLLLLGGRAADAFLGYADNVTRWRGHYEVLLSPLPVWYSKVVERLERRMGKGKKSPSMGKAAVIENAVKGIEDDLLSTPSLPSPIYKREKRGRRVRCKSCKELGGHKNGCDLGKV